MQRSYEELINEGWTGITKYYLRWVLFGFSVAAILLDILWLIFIFNPTFIGIYGGPKLIISILVSLVFNFVELILYYLYFYQKKSPIILKQFYYAFSIINFVAMTVVTIFSNTYSIGTLYSSYNRVYMYQNNIQKVPNGDNLYNTWKSKYPTALSQKYYFVSHIGLPSNTNFFIVVSWAFTLFGQAVIMFISDGSLKID